MGVGGQLVMVVMGGPSGVVEVGDAVDEGVDEEFGVSEEMGASVVVEASTEGTMATELETGSDVVEGSGSGRADEETSVKVDEGTTSKDVEEGMTSNEVEEVTSREVETEITSEEVERVGTRVFTDDCVKERLGLHLPGRAEAEARKSGKSDKSRAVERVCAMTAKEAATAK